MGEELDVGCEGAVFISYAHEDRNAAQTLYQALRRAGTKCWMAPDDIPPGVDWTEAIYAAARQASAILLVYSSHTDASRHVKNEVSRALALGKHIIPVRIEACDLAPFFEFHLGWVQWLDAAQEPLQACASELVEQIQRSLQLAGKVAKRVTGERPGEAVGHLRADLGADTGAAGVQRAVPSPPTVRRVSLAQPLMAAGARAGKWAYAAGRRAVLAPVACVLWMARSIDAGMAWADKALANIPMWLLLAYLVAPAALVGAGAIAQVGAFAPPDVRRAVKAASENPADPDLRIQLGEAYYRHGRYLDAMTQYACALLLRPYDARAAWALHQACLAAGRKAEAANALARYVSLDATSERGSQAIRRLQSMGRRDLAITAVEAYARARPDEEGAHYLLGRLYFQSGRYEDAIAEYRRALEIKPDALANIYAIAEAYNRLGMWTKAAAAYTEYLRHDATSSQSRVASNFVATYKRRLSNIDSAVRHLIAEWARAQNSGDFEAYAALYSDNFSGVVRWCTKDGQTLSYKVPDLHTWLKRRRPRIARRKYTIKAGTPAIEEYRATGEREEVTISFPQEFDSDTYADSGIKVMKLVRSAPSSEQSFGGWRIVYEDMRSCRRQKE